MAGAVLDEVGVQQQIDAFVSRAPLCAAVFAVSSGNPRLAAQALDLFTGAHLMVARRMTQVLVTHAFGARAPSPQEITRFVDLVDKSLQDAALTLAPRLSVAALTDVFHGTNHLVDSVAPDVLAQVYLTSSAFCVARYRVPVSTVMSLIAAVKRQLMAEGYAVDAAY